ncbi:hypothetical protein PFISCL1PPCAC_18714, partial [Pristionchus fissidentatus]
DSSDYTVFLSTQSGLILVAFLIFFFTLRVMSSFSAIHGNCKFFLLLTAFGQCCILLSHTFKVCFWFTVENFNRFVMYKQPFFKAVQPLNEFGYFLTDCNSFLLIMERTIACSKSKSSYEESGTHWSILIACETICMGLSAFCAYLIHFEGRALECCLIAISIDIVSLIVLAICFAYCRRSYANLVDVGSRYQMREVEYITRALLPACLITFLLRAFALAIAIFTYFKPDIFPTYIIFISAFHCIQTVNSAQYGLVIVLRHEFVSL